MMLLVFGAGVVVGILLVVLARGLVVGFDA